MQDRETAGDCHMLSTKNVLPWVSKIHIFWRHNRETTQENTPENPNSNHDRGFNTLY